MIIAASIFGTMLLYSFLGTLIGELCHRNSEWKWKDSLGYSSTAMSVAILWPIMLGPALAMIWLARQNKKAEQLRLEQQEQEKILKEAGLA